jgi:hypothetical protein
MAKYKGTARALAFKQDSTNILSQVVRTFGNQTVNGVKTFSSNVNGLSFNNIYLRLNTTDSSYFAGSYFTGLSNTGDSSNGFGARALQSNTGEFSNAFGRNSGKNNTGIWLTAMGDAAAENNTGEKGTFVGFRSGQNNTGANSTAVGDGALQFSSGANSATLGNDAGFANTEYGLTAMGWASARYQTGEKATFHGVLSGYLNIGDSSVGIGGVSGYYNESRKATYLGYNAGGTFRENAAAAKTFGFSNINVGAQTITITAHGFGASNTYRLLKYTEGTSAIGGMVSGTVYKFWIVDANTIMTSSVALGQFEITSAGSGTGHTLTPQFIYNHATAIGYGSFNTQDNQIMLGDSTDVEVRTFGQFKGNGMNLFGVANIFNANINLSNDYYYSGKTVGGTNIGLLGMNTSDKVSLDANAYGVVAGGSITAGSFIKSGGTSSQFLMADGSTNSASYLPLSGGTLTGTLNITNANLNLSNAFFLAGKLVAGTNIALIGMNGSDKVSLDPNGYGVVVGNTLNAAGAITGNTIVKSGGTSSQALIADGSVQTLTSGTYTPTITGVTNISASSAATCYYTRVGNVVNVSGYVNITATANTYTEFKLSLPVSSTISTYSDLSGNGLYRFGSVTHIPASIDGNANEALVRLGTATNNGVSTQVQFTFTYRVI